MHVESSVCQIESTGHDETTWGACMRKSSFLIHTNNGPSHFYPFSTDWFFDGIGTVCPYFITPLIVFIPSLAFSVLWADAFQHVRSWTSVACSVKIAMWWCSIGLGRIMTRCFVTTFQPCDVRQLLLWSLGCTKLSPHFPVLDQRRSVFTRLFSSLPVTWRQDSCLM